MDVEAAITRLYTVRRVDHPESVDTTPKAEQEYRIEKCGGLTVYHPIKKQAEVIPLKSSWQLSLENKLREKLEAA